MGLELLGCVGHDCPIWAKKHPYDGNALTCTIDMLNDTRPV